MSKTKGALRFDWKGMLKCESSRELFDTVRIGLEAGASSARERTALSSLSADEMEASLWSSVVEVNERSCCPDDSATMN